MKRKLSMDEWASIKSLVQVDYYQTCPPFASFSMAGETHKVYTDGTNTYEAVEGNGFCVYYVFEDD